jgi:hypothetical protein
MAAPGWVERLKKRWGLTSNWEFALIFTVFAVTGTTTAISKRYFFAWAGIGTEPLWLYILCYIGYMLIAYQFNINPFFFLLRSYNTLAFL